MNQRDRDAPFHVAGWILFVICALLFLYVAVRDGDPVLSLASLVFLGGCIAFLLPLLCKDGRNEGRAGDEASDPAPEER